MTYAYQTTAALEASESGPRAAGPQGGLDGLRPQLRGLDLAQQQAMLSPDGGVLGPLGPIDDKGQPAPVEDRPYLRFGSRGPSVAELQGDLNRLGESLDVDEIFGTLTHQAVLRFQLGHGLDADGIVGPLTWGALDASQPAAPPAKQDKPTGDKGKGGTATGKEDKPEEKGKSDKPEDKDKPEDRFKTPIVKFTYLAYKGDKEPTAAQMEALLSLDEPAAGSVWANVKWKDCQKGGAHRILDPNQIKQGGLGLCGPAGIVNALVTSDPVGYATLVREIYETGAFVGGEACEDLRNAELFAGDEDGLALDPVDWMVLSTMRDAANGVFDYTGQGDEDLDGISSPWEVMDWMEQLLGCVETERWTSYLWGEVSNAKAVNNVMASHGDDVVVMMLVDGDVLRDDDFTLNVPTHYARLLDPITFNPDGSIDLRCFSWGTVYSDKYPGAQPDGYHRHLEDEDEFEDLIFEFVVGSRKKGVL